MTGLPCPREPDAIRAARAGVLREDSGFAEHVAACASCRDAIALATAFRADQEAALQEARVPSPGLVWWKAERQTRREQVRAASRPILVAHGVARVAVVAAILTAASRLAPHADPLAASLGAWRRMSVRLPLPSLDLATLAQPGILLVAAAALVLAPLALYLALSRE